MRIFTVLGVPRGFPCRAAALHVLRAAQEQRMDRIRIDKGGHVCEFSVDEVARAAHPRDTLVTAGTTRGLLANGGTFEWRKQNWPGMGPGPHADVSLQRPTE